LLERRAWGLKYASAALQRDQEVVVAAVMNDGSALGFASAELQADPVMISISKKAGHFGMRALPFCKINR
jgi:hypothetical protein